MKIKNRAFYYGAAVLLLLALTSCGPSGSISTDLESQLGAYGVAVLCDGAECGTNVKSTSVISATFTPLTGDTDILGSSNVSAEIVCGGSAYPLTVSSEQVVDLSLVVEYMHDKLPGITDCVIRFELVTDDAAKGDAIAEGESLEIPITTMCPTNVEVFDNIKLPECWEYALIQNMAGGAVRGGAANDFIRQGLKAPSAATLFAFTGLDIIRGLGFTIEVDPTMKAFIIQAPANMTGTYLYIYKRFGDVAPDFGMGFDNTPMRYVEGGMQQPEYEGFATLIVDSEDPQTSCSGVGNEYGKVWNFGGGGGGGVPKAAPPAAVGNCMGYVDLPGLKLLALQMKLVDSACGFTVDTVAQRMMALKMSQVNAEACLSGQGGTNNIGIAGNWTMTTGGSDHMWAAKPDPIPEQPSTYFDEGGTSGHSAGIFYSSNVRAGAGQMNLGESVEPFTLMLKSVNFSVPAVGQE